MNLNITDEKRKNENKQNKKMMIINTLIIIFCVIALGITIYTTMNPNKIETEEKQETEEEKEERILLLKENFNKNFINKEIERPSEEIKKQTDKEKMIFTKIKINKKEEEKFEFNIYIPYLNIETEAAREINKEIDKLFVETARQIVEKEKEADNTIYTVEYAANIKDDILSIMIKSSYKATGKPQKIILHTFNYDLKENKKVNINELIEKEKLDKNKIQNEIIEEIKKEQKNAEELSNYGYEIYKRDVNSNIYKVENTTEFYITENEIYLIYPYGNLNETTEMDIIII